MGDEYVKSDMRKLFEEFAETFGKHMEEKAKSDPSWKLEDKNKHDKLISAAAALAVLADRLSKRAACVDPSCFAAHQKMLTDELSTPKVKKAVTSPMPPPIYFGKEIGKA